MREAAMWIGFALGFFAGGCWLMDWWADKLDQRALRREQLQRYGYSWSCSQARAAFDGFVTGTLRDDLYRPLEVHLRLCRACDQELGKRLCEILDRERSQGAKGAATHG